MQMLNSRKLVQETSVFSVRVRPSCRVKGAGLSRFLAASAVNCVVEQNVFTCTWPIESLVSSRLANAEPATL